ncbi:MAG: hypothetical protein VX228_00980, partial [Pseudomonadota bacterium]|nr:hypothetical protein [Pseudomonadota bacterium]
MARSLGLAAYLAFARRQPPRLAEIDCPRPKGVVVWLHSTDPTRARTLAMATRRTASTAITARRHQRNHHDQHTLYNPHN